MKYDLDLIWKSMTNILREKVSSDVFQRWFKAIQLADADDSRVTLRVPNNLCKLWLETNYLGLLQSSFQKVLGSPRRIRFTTVESPENKGETTPQAAMNPVLNEAISAIQSSGSPAKQSEASPTEVKPKPRITFDE